ncbi:MAG: phosphotransferase, partial [Chloroflexi bacterium]|nr:phosphotransferase [Chloroflexota bacterium]
VWWPSVLREVGSGRRVIGHCDPGPWNILGREGLPVAFIDWECAGPVDPLLELAHAAWLNAQLHDDAIAAEVGLPPLAERAQHLRAVLDGYELARPRRRDFVDRMVNAAMCFLADNANEYQVGRTSTGPLWGFAWPSRSGAWMLQHRTMLENALSR